MVFWKYAANLKCDINKVTLHSDSMHNNVYSTVILKLINFSGRYHFRL